MNILVKHALLPHQEHSLVMVSLREVFLPSVIATSAVLPNSISLSVTKHGELTYFAGNFFQDHSECKRITAKKCLHGMNDENQSLQEHLGISSPAPKLRLYHSDVCLLFTLNNPVAGSTILDKSVETLCFQKEILS